MILVTGGAGFIGSHLAKRLALNHSVIVDIRDEVAVRKVFAKYNINVVFHLASHSYVDNSFSNSLEFTQTNVVGTHILLDISREFNVQKFIHVSTDEVYGEINFEEPSALESNPTWPTTPYAASKAAAESIALAYYKSFNLPLIITRSSNIYGPCQYPEKIIPRFICQQVQGKACTIQGDGTHVRNYLYITDIVDAFELILEQGVVGEIYNISSDYDISNIELARLICKYFGTNEIVHIKDRIYNDCRYSIDSSKIRKLGWSAKVSFQEGLVDTTNWYQQNRQNWWDNFPPLE
ncbi:hypothetical protein HDV06_000100 [Boothiomyces sp. JEL0866]|nr:hypothetical protein HDV06_000100 [Boothiomyces sp. JEL0866]